MQKSSLERFLQMRIVQHVLFWIAIYFYFLIGYTRNGRWGVEAVRSLAFLPVHIYLVYVFFYFLLPKFLYTKRFALFTVLAILAYAISTQLSCLINFFILGNKKTAWNFGALILGQSTVLGIALSIKLLKNWYRQRQQIQEAERQKISAELELLKSQVHPHFLFNTLNNLYAHTLQASSQAPEIVLKLSHLLRFMIYESNAAFIPLKKEIALLQEYMELEQLRYGDRLDISIAVRGNIEDRQIAPLLLLPLVENAFKHGTSKQLDQCWISFDLEVKGGHMIFKLVNSKDAEPRQQQEVGGVGLQNVMKRLNYLYGDKFRLTTVEEEEVFIVTLELELVQTQPTIIPYEATPLNQSHGAKMFISR